MKKIIFLAVFFGVFLNTGSTQNRDILTITLGSERRVALNNSPGSLNWAKGVDIKVDAGSNCNAPQLFTKKTGSKAISIPPKNDSTPFVFSLSLDTKGFDSLIIMCGDTLFNEVPFFVKGGSDKIETLKFSASTKPGPKGDSIRLEFLGNGDIQKSYREGAPLQANTGLGVSFQRLWYGADTITFRYKDTTITYHVKKHGKANKSSATSTVPASPPANASNDRSKTVIHERHFIQDLSLDFVINVASTADSTVAKYDANKILQNGRDFGTYLLIPINSRQAAYLDFNMYFSNKRKHDFSSKFFSIVNGFNFRFAASNNSWVYQEKDSDDAQTINATGIMMRGGFFYDFIPDNIRRKNNYSVTVGANYSFRGLYGDVSEDENQMKENRMALLGTTQKRWHGFEFSLGIRFKNIRAEVQIPTMYRKKEGGVSGLTNTQFITSIRFVGGFPLGIE